MKRSVIARLIVSFIGIGVWGYGNSTDQANVRVIGMVILGVAILMRFMPKRWFDGPEA
jgi:hypothetical protein